MNHPIRNFLLGLGLLSAFILQPSTSLAQATAFTYQGRLNDGANSASGIYDLRFAIYDAAGSGTPQGVAVTNSPTAVSNGLFAVTLDFGVNIFTGNPRWLEIGVRTNGGGAFTTLTPRQPLTPSPYAIYSGRAGMAGNFSGNLVGDVSGTQGATVVGSVGGYVATAVASGASAANAAGSASLPGTLVKRDGAGNFAAASISGAFIGNGAGLTNLTLPAANLTGTINGAQIAPAAIGTSHLNTSNSPVTGQILGFSGSGLAWANNAALGNWSLNGNAGTTPGTHFLGTTDNQPLEFKVNNTRALRIEPNTSGGPNVIAGAPVNFVGAGVVGATIAGGGASNYGGFAYFNSVLADFSVVGGGRGNSIAANSVYATIAGGYNNTIAMNSSYATIAGGFINNIGTNSNFSAIGGGLENTIASETSRATIGGGRQNQIQTGAHHATIGGGFQNTIRTNAVYATIPGGWGNAATDYAFAAGRRAKANHTGAFVWADATDADFASTANNQFSIRASGGLRLSDDTPSLAFGSTTRQMLNLWGTVYAIGVQNNTLYTRSDGGFAWFNKGTHSNTSNDAGSGGTPLMTLDSAGNLRTVTGTLSTLSDRNAKANFEPVDARDVLERVAALPITRWNLKSAPATQRHIGPMAQDFHAAFNVGLEATGICTVDADGVALAAIQGLNEKVEVSIQELRAENAELKQRLDKLERLMNRENGGAR
jgi:hypothetical protein